MSLFNELKRRNVFKVAAAYIIVAWLILQVGEVLAPALRLPAWVNSMLAFFLLLGFPIALFFAWAFELTPEGLKKEKDVDRGESITQVTGRKLDFWIIGLLVIALGYFAWDKFVLDPRRDAELVAAGPAAGLSHAVPADDSRKSIAVLPLADMSPGGDHEYFSDGLTEELLNILARIQDLKVAGRTSSFAFKGRNEDLREIGKKLNVDSILEGSVRKDDARNRVRITLQLINAEDGYHLWSDTYDRDLDDIFAIQEEVAHEVVDALRVTLLGEDEARLDRIATTDIDAYELYLQGLKGINEGGFDSLEVAADRLRRALVTDPGYLPARLALVKTWSEQANTGAMTQREAITRGMPILEGILAREPGNANAQVQLAIFRDFEGDFDGAERAFNTALELEPHNASALQEYGRFLFNHNDVDRGLELIDRAVENEPYAIRVLWDQCQANAQAHRPAKAAPACARIGEIDPESPLSAYGLGLVAGYQGDLAGMAKGYGDAILLDPGDFEMVAMMSTLWNEMGDYDQGQVWQERALAIGAGQAAPNTAQLYGYQVREQHERAERFAARALAANPENRHGLNYHFLRGAAYSATLRGDWEAGLEPFRQIHPWAFEDSLVPPADAGFYADDVIMIAALMKQADPLSERADQLLALCASLVDDYYPGWGVFHADLRRARIEAIRGNHEQAIEHLNSAKDQGWRFDWRRSLYYDPVTHPLKSEPAYQDLVAFMEADMEQQRERAHDLLGVRP